MTSRLVLVGFIAACVLTSAGCGSSESGVSQSRMESAEKCLNDGEPRSVTGPTALTYAAQSRYPGIAVTAVDDGNGWFDGVVGTVPLEVFAYRDADAATKGLEVLKSQSLKSFTRAAQTAELHGNVIVTYFGTPSSVQRSKVEACLKRDQPGRLSALVTPARREALQLAANKKAELKAQQEIRADPSEFVSEFSTGIEGCLVLEQNGIDYQLDESDDGLQVVPKVVPVPTESSTYFVVPESDGGFRDDPSEFLDVLIYTTHESAKQAQDNLKSRLRASSILVETALLVPSRPLSSSSRAAITTCTKNTSAAAVDTVVKRKVDPEQAMRDEAGLG